MIMKSWLYMALFICTTVTCGSVGITECRYELHIPLDLDFPETPHFDTTIVRTTTCVKHLLRLPPQGTETRYIFRMDTVERDLHFGFDEDSKQWLDISLMPAGEYHVRLLACGNGGSFTLHIK